MPETTEHYHRVPTGKKKSKNAKIRTINISKGIKALYDVDTKAIITYIFDKDKYTMKEAKKWVKEHKENSSIMDVLIELDYVIYKRTELAVNQKSEVYDNLQIGNDIEI